AAPDPAGVDRRAEPGHHAAAQQAGDLRLRPGVDLRALAGRDERLVGERADAEGRGQLRADLEGHLLLGVVGVEAVPGTPAQARPALPAHRPPVQDHEVAGFDLGDPVAHLLHDSGGLVPEPEGELVVDAALAVVQVDVADPARLDRHDRLPGPGVRNGDRLDAHGLSPARCDDPAYLLRHAASHGLRRVPDPTHPGMPVSSGSGERAGQVKRMAWSLSAVSRSRTVTPAAGGRGPPPRARAMSGRQRRQWRANVAAVTTRPRAYWPARAVAGSTSMRMRCRSLPRRCAI